MIHSRFVSDSMKRSDKAFGCNENFQRFILFVGEENCKRSKRRIACACVCGIEMAERCFWFHRNPERVWQIIRMRQYGSVFTYGNCMWPESKTVRYCIHDSNVEFDTRQLTFSAIWLHFYENEYRETADWHMIVWFMLLSVETLCAVLS